MLVLWCYRVPRATQGFPALSMGEKFAVYVRASPVIVWDHKKCPMILEICNIS